MHYKYLNDFLLIGTPASVECDAHLSTLLTTFDRLGLPVAPKKLEGPSGVEGILTKIQRIVIAIRYYKFEVADESDSVTWHRCERVAARYKEWCAALIPA